MIKRKDILELTEFAVMSALQCYGMGSSARMKHLGGFEAEVRSQFRLLNEMSEKEMLTELNTVRRMCSTSRKKYRRGVA